MNKLFKHESFKLALTIALIMFVVLGAIFLVFDFPKEQVLAEELDDLFTYYDERTLSEVSSSIFNSLPAGRLYKLVIDFVSIREAGFRLYVNFSGTGNSSVQVYEFAPASGSTGNQDIVYFYCKTSGNLSVSSAYATTYKYTLYYLDVDYSQAYLEGIEFADGRINTASASYVFGVEEGYGTGYSAGIEYAKNTIDDTSVSYTYGYNLGYHEAEEHYLNIITSSDLYQLGFEAGIEWADTRVNTESASYVSGYSNGYQAGYNFAWNTINIASPNFQAGFISYNSGLFATATFNASMTFTDSTGNNSYNKASNFDTSLLGFFIDNGEGRGAVDFKALRNFLHDNYSTTSSDLLMNLELSLSIPDTEINKDLKFYFNGQVNNLDVFAYDKNSDEPNYIYLTLDDSNAPFTYKFNTGFNGSIINTLVFSWNYLESWDHCYSWNINNQFQSGYNAGVYYADHRVNDSSKSYTQAVKDTNAKIIESSESYKAGYTKGYNSVNTSSATYMQAYNKGYNAGADKASNYSFLSLMSAVIDAPIKAFTSLLDFNVFGFNVKGILIGLLSTAAVIAVLAFFLGRKRS